MEVQTSFLTSILPSPCQNGGTVDLGRTKTRFPRALTKKGNTVDVASGLEPPNATVPPSAHGAPAKTDRSCTPGANNSSSCRLPSADVITESLHNISEVVPSSTAVSSSAVVTGVSGAFQVDSGEVVVEVESLGAVENATREPFLLTQLGVFFLHFVRPKSWKYSRNKAGYVTA